MTFTRQEYVHSNLSDRTVSWELHRRYYAQFVNDRTIAHVYRGIGGANLMESTDPYLNDVETLKVWDAVATAAMPLAIKFADVGDYPTLGGLVCVAKEAARQWIEKEV